MAAGILGDAMTHYTVTNAFSFSTVYVYLKHHWLCFCKDSPRLAFDISLCVFDCL